MAFCLFFMLACFVPYVTNLVKDAQQHCGNCGTLLVTRCVDKTVKVHVHV